MKRIISFLILSLLTFKLPATVFSESGITPWGTDAGLAYIKKEKTESEKPKLTSTLSVGQKSCSVMIHFFQNYISPIDGPRSSFYPTSSQYTLEAIQKHGVFRGISMGCDRLMRENGEMWVYETTEKYGIERKFDPVHLPRKSVRNPGYSFGKRSSSFVTFPSVIFSISFASFAFGMLPLSKL